MNKNKLQKSIFAVVLFLIFFSASLNINNPNIVSVAPVARAGFISDTWNNLKSKADSIIKKITGKETPNTDSIDPTQDTFSVNEPRFIIDPNIAQEKQDVSVTFRSNNNINANNSTVLIVTPNMEFAAGKISVCKSITPESNKFIDKKIATCENGNCDSTYNINIPESQLTKNYKIQLIGLTSTEPISDACNPNSIISMTSAFINVGGKQTEDTSVTTQVPGAIKGKIRITAPTMVDNGAAVIVNVATEGHKGDELMLWISDCDGKLFPKILFSDHSARTIPNNSYTYRYTWDTQKAQTKTCKHYVKAKTYTKGSTNQWVWNDQAQYKITVGEKTVDSAQICVMQLDKLTADEGDENPTPATVVDSKITVKSNKVKIKWNGVCGAKYQVYRNDQLLGETYETSYSDTLDNTGEYKYRVEAYINKAAANGPADPTSGGIDNYDPNLSYNWLLQKVVSLGLIMPAKAELDFEKVSSQDIVLKYDTVYKDVSTATGSGSAATGSGATATGGSKTCADGQIQLGLPLPEKVGNKFQLKYCATNLPDYMKTIYDFLIVIASLSAVISIIIGGYMYISSSGEPAKINTAKEIIIGALVGLALLISAGFIMNTIGIPT